MNKQFFNIKVIVDGLVREFSIRHTDEASARNMLNFQLANSGAIYKFI